MNNSRVKNTLLNISFGYATQVGTLLLGFIGRKVFLHFLPIDLLGINGLYTNILTALSFADLGLDSAVLYSLYKPVSEGNNELVSSMIHYFKKVYAGLAFAIFAIGLLLIPVLKYIVRSDLPQDQIIIYYLIFLLNTVLTYFAAHKVALLTACQEQRVQKTVALLSSMILQLLHILVLIIWKNYYAYLGVTLLGSVINVVILSVVCDKRHPDMCSYRSKLSVPFDKKTVIDRVKFTFPYKVGTVVVDSTDNILISIIVNTAAVGLYSNYLVAVIAIQGFISTITRSMTGSLGSLCAQKDNKTRQLSVFRSMLLFYHMVASIGGIGLALLLDNFIELWLGNQYLLGMPTCIAIAVSFYLTNAISPIWMFREANGLFREVRFLLLTTAACNIVLSIILGKLMGVFGILIATSISRIITNVWYEPGLLFHCVFRSSAKQYWIQQIWYFTLALVSFAASFGTISILPDGLFGFVLKAISVVIITGCLFTITNCKTDEFRSLLSIIIRSKRKGV